jgi:hypothetical protein
MQGLPMEIEEAELVREVATFFSKFGVLRPDELDGKL